jgi:hypothetical protein
MSYLQDVPNIIGYRSLKDLSGRDLGLCGSNVTTLKAEKAAPKKAAKAHKLEIAKEKRVVCDVAKVVRKREKAEECLHLRFVLPYLQSTGAERFGTRLRLP